MKERPIIIFIHLPKCGGTTLSRLIQWEYGPLRVFSVDGRFYRWSWNKLVRSATDKLSGIEVFEGHMPFGLHKLLHAPCTYMTVLREPIDRVISEYYYRRRRWQHQYEDRAMKKLSLEEYVRTNPQHNIQTKLLAGQPSGYDFVAAECNAETLAIAKENLARHFSLVGLTEHFDESLALAKLTFGWKIRNYADFNVTPVRPTTDRVSAAVRDLIADRYRYDLALYEYAVVRFREAVASRAAEVRAELRQIMQARSQSAIASRFFRTASWTRNTISRLHSAILIV